MAFLIPEKYANSKSYKISSDHMKEGIRRKYFPQLYDKLKKDLGEDYQEGDAEKCTQDLIDHFSATHHFHDMVLRYRTWLLNQSRLRKLGKKINLDVSTH